MSDHRPGHQSTPGSAAAPEENLDTAALGERRRRREAERARERQQAAERPLTRRELRARDEAIASGALPLGDGAARPGDTGPVPSGSPAYEWPARPSRGAHSAAAPSSITSVSSVSSAAAPTGPREDAASASPGAPADPSAPTGSTAPAVPAAPATRTDWPSSAAVPTDEHGRPLTRRQLRERAAREEAERQARLEEERAQRPPAGGPAPQQRPSYSSVQALRSGPLGVPPNLTASAGSAPTAPDAVSTPGTSAAAAQPAGSAAPADAPAPPSSAGGAVTSSSAGSTSTPTATEAPGSSESVDSPDSVDDLESTQAFVPRWRSVSDSGPIARPGAPTGRRAAASTGSAMSAGSATSGDSAGSAGSAAEPPGESAGPKRVSYRDAELSDPGARSAESAPERTLRRPIVRPETGEISRGPDPTGTVESHVPRRRSVYTAIVPGERGEDVPVAESTSPVHWHSTAADAAVTADVTGDLGRVDAPTVDPDDTGPMPPASLDAVVAGEDDTGEQFPARPEWAAVSSVGSIGSAATGAIPTAGPARRSPASTASPTASAATGGEETSSEIEDDEASPHWLTALQWLVIIAVAVVLGMLVWYVVTGGLSGEENALGQTPMWRKT